MQTHAADRFTFIRSRLGCAVGSRITIRVIGWVLLTLAAAGCASDTPLNPSFPLTRDDAAGAIRQMESDPKSLSRPVVVLGGIHDPGLAAQHIAEVIRDTTPDGDRSRIIHVSFFETWSFDACADKLMRRIDAAFPNDDAQQTIEVDAVGFSMGGLIARYAASDEYAAKRGRRLRLARLFTIASPHTGADLAALPTFDSRAKDMRAGSAFLTQLNGEQRKGDSSSDYPLFAYVRLEDGIVGEEHAAPPGVAPWWVPSGFTFSHILAAWDKRILADILRRLRNQEPFSIEPAAPFSKD